MDTTKHITKTMSVGEAAVEGLLGGIGAGLAMGLFILGLGALLGASPLTVLTYFNAGDNVSPWTGLFTHIAVSGMYGVVFGIGLMLLARLMGSRTRDWWLVVGLVYGVLIFGIAESIILPDTHSALQDLPVWVMGIAHVLYGIILARLTTRNS
jgi:uncharacterized membrane protein YagU involved in acid resistance